VLINSNAKIKSLNTTRLRHATLDIQVLACYIHKKYDGVVPVNVIPTLPLWSLDIQW